MPVQGRIPASEWSFSSAVSSLSSSSPSTSPAPWRSPSPGCPSGWTTRQCPPEWPWEWRPCWRCPPRRPAYRTPSRPWPTPRPSTSGPGSVSSSSSELYSSTQWSTTPPGKMSDNHQDISYLQNFAIYMNINFSILFFLNVKKCKKHYFGKLNQQCYIIQRSTTLAIIWHFEWLILIYIWFKMFNKILIQFLWYCQRRAKYALVLNGAGKCQE